ncbi:unnamed protein product [Rotaria sordida]|uniref:Uncharacterized protein n=1 Tax=Rotaria sordida TaxID=392033 RepID=A0A814AEQ9_9BILA|nr:unnamed protein product [Rotaria sordida]
MVIGSLNMTSTVTTDAEKHLFYSHLKELHLFIPLNMAAIDIPSSSPLFQNLDHLIIETSSKLIHLVIGTPLLLHTTLLDNSLLIPVFSQLQSLYMIPENVYFPFEYASKLVERFPSLVHVELRIICLGTDALLVDTLLRGLAKLIHLKIFFTYRLYIDETCSVDYVIERRRQAFPFNIWNKDEVLVNIDEQLLEIYLSGCSICVNIPYVV